MQADDSEDEDEDYRIKSTDSVLLAAKIEDESSSLEVHIYEEEKFNVYVHHELRLNSFPVALEWLCCDFNKAEGDSYLKANIAVVGLMNSAIELWDLDVLEVIEPLAVVGNADGHADSVTNLAIHPSRANVLASSSADRSIKFWDLQKNKEVARLSEMAQVPQNVVWDLESEACLHTYSSDNVVRTIDARVPKVVSHLKAKFAIENIAVSPVCPQLIFVACEDGSVRTVDKKSNKVMSELTAKIHKEAMTSIVCNQAGHLVSNSLDGSVAVLSVADLSILATQETDCKKLFGSSIHPESQHLFACGSEIGEVVFWDFTHSIKAVK